MIASIVADIAARFNLRKHGNRYVGPCPKCGGSNRTDKFNIRDDGGFKCYACEFKGDIIGWLREMDGMTCPQAHEAAGLPCRAATCPVKSTCRLGDGSGERTRTARVLRPAAARATRSSAPALVRAPKTPWAAWAEEIAERAASHLAANQMAVNYLAGRGIHYTAAQASGLGWLPSPVYVDRRAIGLPVDDKDRLWVPAGLVIPVRAADGSINRLNIRRHEADRARFLPDLKYYVVPGSGTDLMHLRPAGPARGVVIVEAELDAIAIAAANDQVDVIAIRTVAAKLSDDLRRVCQAATVILVALDADAKTAAGQKAAVAWTADYPQAVYWPVFSGKDPGDFAAQGGNLRTWIEAGLPPVVTAPAPAIISHDPAPMPLDAQTGGEGGEFIAYGLSGGGLKYILVKTRGDWRRMVERHPGVAIVGASELERIDAKNADDVLRVKQIFGAAEVLAQKRLEK